MNTLNKKMVYFHVCIFEDSILSEYTDNYGNTNVSELKKKIPWVDGIINAFEELGYVVYFDYKRNFFFSFKKKLKKPFYLFLGKIFRKLFKSLEEYFFCRYVFQNIENHNASIYFTVLNPYISKSFLEKLKHRGVKTVEWFGVFPFNFSKKSPQLKLVPFFDLLVSGGNILPFFDSSNKPTNFLETCVGANPSVYKELNLTVSEMETFGADIVFVGSVGKWHSNRWDILEIVYQEFSSLKFYGLGVEQVPSKYNFVKSYKGPVWGDNYIRVINSSKINLNLLLDGFRKLDSGLNQRTYEIMACGGFQLIQFNANVEKCFKIGTEIEVFKNANDLIKKIKYYLNNPDKRIEIAIKGKRKVLKEFTCKNQVISIVEDGIKKL